MARQGKARLITNPATPSGVKWTKTADYRKLASADKYANQPSIDKETDESIRMLKEYMAAAGVVNVVVRFNPEYDMVVVEYPVDISRSEKKTIDTVMKEFNKNNEMKLDGPERETYNDMNPKWRGFKWYEYYGKVPGWYHRARARQRKAFYGK
ncbi:MAG: hypothetical protein MPK62_02210 [Alphaproteobacteria bacterium]|nr:hypothetical protein [Alphaproteobacteria bacterium]